VFIGMRLAPKKRGARAIGRSRGGLTTKIHALVEGLGNLARWRLSAGQAADVTEAETLLAGIAARFVAADKAYDCDALIKTILRSERDLHRREQGTRSAEFQIAKGGVGEVALVGDVLHVDSPGGQVARRPAPMRCS
jgi:hypothetical protein